ncbi:MAG: polysaccharide synthesis protein GtrA, partial [Sphingomonas sp.]|nr:polysaccharide synthesis protein GtrA [Sphingomonas sp.]
RDSGGRQQAKFVVVQGVGLSLNAAFTWGMTALLGLPSWAALIPVITITPIATFVLNRQWVFGGRAAHG